MFAAIATALITAISSSWGNYQERKAAEHQTNLSLELSKQKIIEQQVANEYALNTERLKSTGKLFKYFTFFMWFGPFIMVFVAPKEATEVFITLKLLPAWYIQSCIAIIFTVWSISVSKETIQTIFVNLGKYLASRRQINLQRKVLFDIMRAASKRPLEQGEVDIGNKMIDIIEKLNEKGR